VVADPARSKNVWQIVGAAPALDQATVNGEGIRQLAYEVLTNHVVQSDRSLYEVQSHQGTIRQTLCPIAGIFLVPHSPERGERREGDVHVLGKYRELETGLPILLVEVLQANRHRRPDRSPTIFLVADLEALDAVLLELAVHVGDRLLEWLATLRALANGGSCQLEHQRPLPQPLGQASELCRKRVAFTPAEHSHRLVRFHFVHQHRIHTVRSRRDVELTGGDEPGADGSTTQERPHVSKVPDVVDHHQTVLALQLLGKRNRGVVLIREARALAGKTRISGEQLPQYVGRLAEGDPEDSIVEGHENPVVVAQLGGEGRLAKTAGAVQSGSNGERIATVRVQHLQKELLVLAWPLHEALGKIRGHEGNPLLGWRTLQVLDEGLPLVVQVVAVGLAHPLGQ